MFTKISGREWLYGYRHEGSNGTNVEVIRYEVGAWEVWQGNDVTGWKNLTGLGTLSYPAAMALGRKVAAK